ncbi:unnamed protein product, partial [Amoebophrya sp. A25]|eukprot:GSA25T00001174001.1
MPRSSPCSSAQEDSNDSGTRFDSTTVPSTRSGTPVAAGAGPKNHVTAFSPPRLLSPEQCRKYYHSSRRDKRATKVKQENQKKSSDADAVEVKSTGIPFMHQVKDQIVGAVAKAAPQPITQISPLPIPAADQVGNVGRAVSEDAASTSSRGAQATSRAGSIMKVSELIETGAGPDACPADSENEDDQQQQQEQRKSGMGGKASDPFGPFFNLNDLGQEGGEGVDSLNVPDAESEDDDVLQLVKQRRGGGSFVGGSEFPDLS